MADIRNDFQAKGSLMRFEEKFLNLDLDMITPTSYRSHSIRPMALWYGVLSPNNLNVKTGSARPVNLLYKAQVD